MYRRANFKLLGLLTLLYIVFFGISVHAQSFTPQGIGVQLISNPTYPNPNSEVTITLDDYSVDTGGASIAWYVNEVEQVQDRNEREITLITGHVGEKTSVRVVLSRPNTPSLSGSLIITPTVVDIIVEADTYTPNFYKGRALPSRESSVRAIAVVNDNSKNPDSAYSYKWSVGSTVLHGGPVKGKNVVEFNIPVFQGGALVVEVFNENGGLIGRHSRALTTVEPELHFYEQNPLRGLSEKTVANPLPLIGEETTIFGEPYFINAQIDPRDAHFTWEINGTETTADSTLAPNAISLKRVGESGEALIGLSIATKRKIPQLLDKAFQIIFQ